MSLFTVITGCTPEPEFNITKPIANKISFLGPQKPILGDNTFSVSAMLSDVKTLNVTDADSKTSDLRVFFDGDKSKNKTIITNSNGISLEVICGGDNGDVNPVQCQFLLMSKEIKNFSETFTTSFHVRDITFDKAKKDVSNISDEGKMTITFYRDLTQISASNTMCSFVINQTTAVCDINNFSPFDSVSKDILVSIMNSEANMADKISCEKFFEAEKLKIRCTLKLLSEISTYPLSKNFSATFKLTNTSNPALSMQDAKTMTFSFSRSPTVYTKNQTFLTSKTLQVPGVDILWVVDNSGSMKDEQMALSSNFESFINSFVPEVNGKRTILYPFKMTAIATDGYLKSGHCNFVKCSDAGNPLLVNDSLAINDYNLFSQNFKSIVEFGINGSGSEKSIDSIIAFTNATPTAFDAKNLLVIIFLTDEMEQSYKIKPCAMSSFTTECNLERVQSLSGEIAKLKSSKDLIKVFSIVDFDNDKGDVYKEISKEFSGTSQSIKDPFSSILKNIGTSITDTFLEYTLSFQGAVKSIKSVTLDGKVLLNANNEDYVFVKPNKIRLKKLPNEGQVLKVLFEYSNEGEKVPQNVVY